jgi:CRISPR type III-A-associated protein Csm2
MAQIRRVFGEVKRLTMRWEPIRLRMLRPKLAYIAARAGRGGQMLRNILTPGIDTVFEAQDENVQQQFKVLADLFEALLAYFYAAERQGGR